MRQRSVLLTTLFATLAVTGPALAQDGAPSQRLQCAQDGQFRFEGHSYFVYTYGNPGVKCTTVLRVVRRFLSADPIRSGWYCRKITEDERGAMGDCHKGGKVMSRKGNMRWKHYLEFYGDDTEGRR